jgi:hypothetical protein
LRAKGQGIFSDLHADTLDVSGAVTLEGGIAVTGDIAVTGNATVTGAASVIGDIKVDPVSGDARLILDKPASGTRSRIVGSMQGVSRWVMDLGGSTPEAVGDVGSNFGLYRCDNAGTATIVMSVDRSNGNTTLYSNTGVGGNLTPSTNGTLNLGAPTARWATVYTSDLSLNNGIGDWTIVEGEDDLFLYNNKRGKVFKFALTEVDPAMATPKMSNDGD